MVSKKHNQSNSNFEGSLSSLGGAAGWPPTSPGSTSTKETPRGGEKKKKVRSSMFGDSFSNPTALMLKAMERPTDDGWMQVQKKKKVKKQRPPSTKDAKSRTSVNRTFSGVTEQELQASKPASRRSSTKNKHNSTKTNNRTNATSTPAIGPAHTAAYYSDEEIKELVRRLAEAHNWEDALEAIRAIRVVLKDENVAKKADAASKLFKFQVVPALVLKLQKYGEDSDQITVRFRKLYAAAAAAAVACD
jgi:hypothetical protein